VAYFIQSTPISMVVELAATPDTVRWWVEQLAVRSDAPTFLAGVSASAEPMSRLIGKSSVSGMIVGVPGATAYRLKLRECSRTTRMDGTGAGASGLHFGNMR